MRGLDCPEAYEAMFRFIYGFDLEKSMPSKNSKYLHFYLAVFCVARTYGCEALASELVDRLADTEWDKESVLLVLGLDPLYDHDELVNCLATGCRYYLHELFGEHKFRDILRRRPQLAVELAVEIGQNHKLFNCRECDEMWALSSAWFDL